MKPDPGMGECPETCIDITDRPHLEPVVDWIGDMPLMHGERDVPYGDPEAEYCLCGHPFYPTCPWRGSGSVMTMVLGDPYGGRLGDTDADA